MLWLVANSGRWMAVSKLRNSLSQFYCYGSEALVTVVRKFTSVLITFLIFDEKNRKGSNCKLNGKSLFICFTIYGFTVMKEAKYLGILEDDKEKK